MGRQNEVTQDHHQVEIRAQLRRADMTLEERRARRVILRKRTGISYRVPKPNKKEAA